MPDFRMLNGKKKGTAIVRFDGSALMIIDGQIHEFENIEGLKEFKTINSIEANIEHIHHESIRPGHLREWEIKISRKESLLKRLL